MMLVIVVILEQREMLTDRLKGTFLRYVTDSKGRRTAVVVDIDAWNALIEALEDLEDAEEMLQAREEQDDLIPWEQVVQEYVAKHPDTQTGDDHL